MAYLNSEILEFLNVGFFSAAIFFFLRGTLKKERGLRILAAGIVILTFGVFLNYLAHTPARDFIFGSLRPETISFIRPAFYIFGGIITFVGIILWFPRITDFQTELALRKNAEEEVTAKNQLIAQVLETSRQGMLLFDENFVVQLTNKRLLELLELPEELGRPGASYKDIIYYVAKNGEYGETPVETVYQQRLELLKNNKTFQFQRVRPDGTILDIDGKWIEGQGMLSTYTDVTMQVRAEKELMESEERFRDFTESASDWMWETDSQLKLAYVSDVGLIFAGRSLDELIESPLLDLIHPTEDTDSWHKSAALFMAYKPFKEVPLLYTEPSGNTRYLSVSGKPVFNSDREFKGFRGVGRDITARRQVEERLRQSQKMEAIGQLTGGIAHDFNNLLAIILGKTEILQERVSEQESPDHPVLNTIEKATLRGAELTQRLLSYSRKQQLKPSPVDLIEGTSGIVSLIERSLGEDIAINVIHDDNLWKAHTDPGQLEDAILNLANNARDAMPNGGTLTIAAENYVHTRFKNDDRLKDLAPGEYVVVSVSDTGVGITEEAQEKIFEPFFTTKEVGKGSGLGLSMVFGFAKQSNGHVCVDSKLNTGTTFKLYLPRAESETRLSA